MAKCTATYSVEQYPNVIKELYLKITVA